MVFLGRDYYDNTSLYDLGNIFEKLALEYKNFRKCLVLKKNDIIN